jgi:hypothetical protein
MPSVPKTRNTKAASTTDKEGTKNPPRATQTSAADVRGVVSNPVTSREKKDSPAPSKVGAHAKASTAKKSAKKESSTSLGVTVTDSLGYKLAALPIANKDKELVANLIADEFGIQDLDRFMREVHRTDVPTPKT